MKVYEGSFVKKDGSERYMRFVKLSDIPDAVRAILFTSGKPPNKLPEGMIHVWDLDANDVRIYNANTATTPLIETDEDVTIQRTVEP